MNRHFTPYIYILFFLFGKTILFAQNKELKIFASDSLHTSFLNSINFEKFHQTEKSVYNEIDSVSKRLNDFGFLNHQVKSVIKKDSIYRTTYELNSNTNNIKIYYDSEIFNKNIIKHYSSNINDNSFTIEIIKVESTLIGLVNDLENNGDTFAEISLKNLSLKNNRLNATLNVKKSTNRKIDEIIVNKYTDFPKSFIKHYLFLKKGSVFNTSKLEYASNAIHSLPFVSEIKPPEVLFTKDSTSIYLYLQKNKSNKFDGLIGFSTDEKGKLNFNGYLDLLLKNIFNKGEQFSINWKSNGNERKIFKLNIETPYIFNSRISPSATFNIYKQDSSFLNINAKFDLSYAINPQNTLSAKYLTEKSNDINSVDVNNIKEYSNSFLGASYTYSKVNVQNPFQNKFYFSVNSFFGKRSLVENSIKDNQQKHELTINYNWTLNQKNSILIKNNSGLFISDMFYTNELYRLGGANSIRGFNEESILASTFSMLNLEYQYYLANKSYIYSITDFAYIENEATKTKSNLYSLGLGYTYQIQSGLIDISYALGKQSELPFDINNSKFHIKLIQFF